MTGRKAIAMGGPLQVVLADDTVLLRPGYGGAGPQRIHKGTICRGGTVCQAQLVDRRLGDYFANEIDSRGHRLRP